MTAKKESYDVDEIKRRLPMMDLLERSGVAMRRAGSGFVGRCPFHDEKTGSFNVGSQRPDRATCYGCGWKGDVIEFWMKARGVPFLDAVAQLASLVDLGPRLTGVSFTHGMKLKKAPARVEARVKPFLPVMRKLKEAEMEQLSALRKLSVCTVELATRKKRVGFALWPQTQVCQVHGWSCYCKQEDCVKGEEFRTNKWSKPSWVVTDNSRNVAQFRPLDGGCYFDQAGIRMLTQGSPTWPIGAGEIGEKDNVIFCEGGADMLAAYYMLSGLSMDHAVAVCCMLGAGNRIAEDALPFFHGKQVRVIADADPIKELVTKHVDGSETIKRSMPGFDAALRWKAQLRAAVAAVETFDLRDLVKADGTPVKDLNDMIQCSAKTMTENELCLAFTAWDF